MAPGNSCCSFSDKFDCLRKGVSAGLILCLFRGKRREHVCVLLRATYNKSGMKIKINENKTTFTSTTVKVGKSCIKVGKSCERWSSHQTKMND